MAFTLLIAGISLSAAVRVQGQRGGPPAAAAPTPKAAAPIDLTGYWVSIVSEDWRYRMVTPDQRRLSGRADDARRGEGRGCVGPGG